MEGAYQFFEVLPARCSARLAFQFFMKILYIATRHEMASIAK